MVFLRLTHSLLRMLWGWDHILFPCLSSFFLSCSVYKMKEIKCMSGQLRVKDGKPYRGCQDATLQLASSLTDEDGCRVWPLSNNWFYNTPLLKTRKDGLWLERNRGYTFPEFLMSCSQAQTHFGLGKNHWNHCSKADRILLRRGRGINGVT